jgi:hypothetical protein
LTAHLEKWGCWKKVRNDYYSSGDSVQIDRTNPEDHHWLRH